VLERKKGVENRAVDALSRKVSLKGGNEENGEFFFYIFICFLFYVVVVFFYLKDLGDYLFMKVVIFHR
jgi:hypothetical protein